MEILTVILVCILVGFGIAILIQGSNVLFFDNVPVKCFVNDKLVYDGKSAGINIDTSGANTTVCVKGGFLYFFPQKYYVSPNVKLEGVK